VELSSLPQARGSECRSFGCLWCFTSAKCVSIISAKSLVHGAHAVCGCVPVAILEPNNILYLIVKVKLNPSQGMKNSATYSSPSYFHFIYLDSLICGQLWFEKYIKLKIPKVNNS
jgi:hypothetical protein